MESHLYFLQAAGIPARVAKALKERPDDATLDADIRALVKLAEKVTRTPPTSGPADIAAATALVGPAGYVDAVGVMLGFNFITRVANALDVDLDMPRWARRIEAVRRVARNVVILALKWLVDLQPRPFA